MGVGPSLWIDTAPDRAPALDRDLEVDVAMASRMGEALAALALGRDAGIPVLTERRRIPLPPEPLRTALYRAITTTLTGIDNRTDRRG